MVQRLAGDRRHADADLVRANSHGFGPVAFDGMGIEGDCGPRVLREWPKEAHTQGSTT